MISLEPLGPNQTIVVIEPGEELFFSYRTLVGIKDHDKYYVQREGQAGSRTTGRHIHNWLMRYQANLITNEVSSDLLQQMASELYPVPF